MEIKKYAAMVKLSLPEEEEFIGAAESLIKSFAAFEGIDTDNVEPLFTVLPVQNILREDFSAKTISREELLSNAPEHFEGYFKVPKTL